MHRSSAPVRKVNSPPQPKRRGVSMVVGMFTLTACMAGVAFSVDLGMVSLVRTRMQGATDAAALAAAMEITHAIQTSGPDVVNVFDYALQQARSTGVSVAQANGVYVNPDVDVVFGRRSKNDVTDQWEIDWNVAPSKTNAVKIIARRDNPNLAEPDGKVPALFSAVMGNKGSIVRAESIAYIEPRDMVVVHDFSRSMNFDSYFSDEVSSPLSKEQIESNLLTVYNDLQPLDLGSMTFAPRYISSTKSNSGATTTITFKGKSVAVTSNTAIKSYKLYYTNNTTSTGSVSGESTTSATWSNSSKRINRVDVTVRKVGSSSQNWTLSHYYDTATISADLGLSSKPYPYASGSWSGYYSYVQSNAGLTSPGYTDMYGGMTWLSYQMKNYPSYFETKDFWKTRHYPFHAIKEGHVLLCDFLTDLKFDDYLGMVSYDSSHRIETKLSDSNPDMPLVDISTTPLTNDYGSVKQLMQYKQAAHYSDSTNMSGGMLEAISLLDNHKRDGSRPAILLMTDGNANVYDNGLSTSLPYGWDWNQMTDYDGDGNANYTTSTASKTVVLRQVKFAVDKGYTIHTICVGNDADTDLLKAIAFIGGGQFIHVPGGQSVADMEAQVEAAFTKIAAAVPPARLVGSPN
ncbi:pilus assembly protein TadG-related protein [Planctellipticum variicoloris]|uniref:pilus assembly protein TadG-related protein n=1 Tax=Planctellipticum variicoloris TaxID=3064265 RepID=UPI003013BBAC|nr:VWA domain-containing protein [Planctomycetaceae bacterium SH412]